MKQQDVTYKTEVTAAVVPEPSVVASQYKMEQTRVTTPMSFVSETVRSFLKVYSQTFVVLHCDFISQSLLILYLLQEFLISAFEERIIQEIELRIMRMTYRQLVTEDAELMVTAADEEAVQPAFDSMLKNYRLMEGMAVTFHCKTAGNPLPKVQWVGLIHISQFN